VVTLEASPPSVALSSPASGTGGAVLDELHPAPPNAATAERPAETARSQRDKQRMLKRLGPDATASTADLPNRRSAVPAAHGPETVRWTWPKPTKRNEA
jgi:hypothetical protein